MRSPEVAVLGAGPAGCVAARQLALAGVDVVLIGESRARDGHAMETFPPSAAPLAEDIGLLASICAVSDGPAAQMHLRWRDEAGTRVFEGDGPLLLPREALHACLRSEALRHSRLLPARVRRISATDTGAEVATDAGTVACKMVVDARGRHSVKRPGSDLVALVFSAQSTVAAHSMWLEALPDAWLWACSREKGAVHGALFQRAAALAGLTAEARLAYVRHQLSRVASFGKVAGVTVSRPAAAGLAAVDDPVRANRHVLVGDAALARDPIASHGLAHAMRSGVQAAVAVRTILDPAGDTEAAISFLRLKHAEAVATARRATARAYRDQCRFTGPFWAVQCEGPEADPVPEIGSGPVTLAAPLTRAPVLDGECIHWAAAIAMPSSSDLFTGFGPVTALDIASACRPSASLNEVATRLGRMHPTPVVFDALRHLALGGAFAQVTRTS